MKLKRSSHHAVSSSRISGAAALDNIVAHLRPGSPVAATGGKQPALWMWPLRPWGTRLHRPFITDCTGRSSPTTPAVHHRLHRPFITDYTGFDRPWRLLAKHLPDLQVRELAFTAGYLAIAHTPCRPADEETL